MKSTIKLRTLLLFLVDVIMLFAALLLSLMVRNGIEAGASMMGSHLQDFSIIFVGWLVIFYIAGLYEIGRFEVDFEFSNKLFWSILIGLLCAVVYFYLAPTIIEPKTTLAFVAIFGYALLWLWRRLFYALSHVLTQRMGVVFVGGDPIVSELVSVLKGNPRLGYQAEAIYVEGVSAFPVEGLDTYTDAESFVWNAVRRDVKLVIMADERELSAQARGALFSLISLPARFVRLPEFYETIFQKVPIGSINDLWFLENIDMRAKRPYEAVKRGLDVLLAAIGMVICVPFFIVLVPVIKLESRGPAIYRQARLGKGGRPFVIRKFRTMREDDNDHSPTSVGDSRVTTFGRVLRATRLDELPQVFNILRGEMSFIGPRPERPELAEELEKSIPFYRQRLLVKPGITGWDQVSGEYHSPSVEDTYKKLQYDLYYVKHLSPLLDISIFLKTIMTVLMRQGR